ncbi:MAG: AraC family transcriptional regulator [Verrucomicrobiota bacterium JB024]|nr:AraC family transcriptional regulator [Verrucomicrobiota bacterium JB024]
MPSRFPASLPAPRSYFHGVTASVRPVSQNAIVFMRTDRASLQQKHFTNRSHHRHVLMLPLDTPGSVLVDGVEIPLREREALLVLPFQFHHYIHLAADKLRWLFVTFDLEQGAALLNPLSYRALPQDEAALALWETIVRLWQGPESAAEEILPVLDRLLLRLLDQSQQEQARAHPKSSWIARAQELVLQATLEGWTLEAVARRIGLSERQLRTRFEAEAGVSIRCYRANYQLHRTLALMRDQRLSLAQIAEMVGFRSSAAFTRFVRRETGKSPSELRRAE